MHRGAAVIGLVYRWYSRMGLQCIVLGEVSFLEVSAVTTTLAPAYILTDKFIFFLCSFCSALKN